MKEILDNQLVRPGDETQFMHAIFSSDDEMMAFYLTLSRLIKPSSHLVERTDKKRLEDLAGAFYSNAEALDVIRDYKSISIKEVIKGFGMHMMNTQISNAKRLQSADAIGTLVNVVMDTTKNSWQFKKMSQVNCIHLENVRYLLDKLKTEPNKEDSKTMDF